MCGACSARRRDRYLVGRAGAGIRRTELAVREQIDQVRGRRRHLVEVGAEIVAGVRGRRLPHRGRGRDQRFRGIDERLQDRGEIRRLRSRGPVPRAARSPA